MSASLESVSAQFSTNCHRLTPAPLVNDVEFMSYIKAVDALVAEGPEGMAAKVAAQLSDLVKNPGWLPQECCEPGADCYKRHLLYADPEGRYTVLALVWKPGQTSPVHGHTAWCAMGVYEGFPSAAAYHWTDQTEPVESHVHHCKPGQIDSVEPGTESPHRVFNQSNDIAITIHTYGRDLVDEPCSINILFE